MQRGFHLIVAMTVVFTISASIDEGLTWSGKSIVTVVG